MWIKRHILRLLCGKENTIFYLVHGDSGKVFSLTPSIVLFPEGVISSQVCIFTQWNPGGIFHTYIRFSELILLEEHSGVNLT